MNAITITAQNFFKELSTGSVNYLLGNVGDKMRVETTIQIQNAVVASSDNPFVVNNNDGYVGGGWLTDAANRFTNFNVGDKIYYFNYVAGTPNWLGYYYIIAKQDNGTIQLNSVADGSGFAPATSGGTPLIDAVGVISNATAITSVKYHYNFIDNNGSDSFSSPVDGSEQIFIIESKAGTDTSTTQMSPLGPPTWQPGLTGSMTTDMGGSSVQVCTITGIIAAVPVSGPNTGIYTTQYKIVHYVDVPRYILYAQLINQMKGIAPADFIPPGNINSGWKFITQIDAAQEYTDPNYLVSDIFDTMLGNIGWYGENFNTGATLYSITGLAYSNGGSTPSIHLDNTTTTFSFTIANTAATPFTSSSKFVLQFFKVPADPTEYDGTSSISAGNYLDQNFCFDRCQQQVGAGAVNGDQYGTGYQALTGVTATLTNSGHIKISGSIAMGASTLAQFNGSSNPQYMIAVAVQTPGISTPTGTLDLVTLQVDLNTFTIITSDPTMITIAPTVFIRHPEVNPATEGVELQDASMSYSWAAWSGGSASFNLTMSSTVIIGGSSSFTVSGQSTIAAAMTAIAAAINAAYPSANAVANTGTKVLSFGPIPGATNADLISWTSAGGGHPTINPTTGSFTGQITMDVYPEDEVVACTNFYINSTGRTGNKILLTNVLMQIVAVNGAKSFVLDYASFDLSSIPLTGYVQVFDSQRARVFHVPASSIRKFVQVQRRADLDSGADYYFSGQFSFLIRWETWVAALGIDPSFLNYSLPNNGLNEWWYQYGQSSGWSLNFQMVIIATKDGAAQQYISTTPFNIHNYASNSAYTTKNVLAFNPAGLAALQSGSGGAVQLQIGGTSPQTINGQAYYKNSTTQYIYAAQKTLIVAIFTKTSAPANVNVCIDVELYQAGGIAGRRRYTSAWVADSDTWFSSTDGSGKVVLEAHGNSIVAYCYLDPNTLNFPSKITQFALDARIYEIGGVLETDDGVTMETDDGVAIQID